VLRVEPVDVAAVQPLGCTPLVGPHTCIIWVCATFTQHTDTHTCRYLITRDARVVIGLCVVHFQGEEAGHTSYNVDDRLAFTNTLGFVWLLVPVAKDRCRRAGDSVIRQ
jgi:hypothetical protein